MRGAVATGPRSGAATPAAPRGVLGLVEHARDDARLLVQPRVPVGWIERLCDELPARRARWLERALPDGDVAVVKVYRRRRAHGIVRRLRAGRAAREAAGYRAFAERGLATVDLLGWGERRRRGLLELGFVVTRRLPARTLADRYLDDFDPAPLRAAIDELARIHASGLAHGDARLRNYLDTRPTPVAFDLALWRRATPASVARDLTSLLASATVLAGDGRLAAALLDRFASRRGLPRPRARLLRRVERAALDMRRP